MSVGRRVIGSSKADRSMLMLYDGDCGFCGRVAEVLGRGPRAHRVAWRPWQSEAVLPAGVTPEHLERAAVLVLPNGRWLSGFYAFRRLTLLLPRLWPLALLLWLP